MIVRIGPKESQRRELREQQSQSIGTQNATTGLRNGVDPVYSKALEVGRTFIDENSADDAAEALARIRASRNARQQRYRNKRKAKGESK